jgi:predicted ATPase
LDLLEREVHLAQLEEHRRQAAAGHGRLVLVGGEAGVGKSALVDAFCRRIAADAAPLRMSCDSLSTPSPLGPALDLAPKLGLLLDHPPVDSEERDRMFRAILDALAARSALTVAVGEDAHWAGSR